MRRGDAFFLPSMGPTAIASHRRLDEKVVDELRVVSWEVPANKTDMKLGGSATVSTSCAEEVIVAERNAAFDSSFCPADDTLSQSGAIEEGVEVIIHLAAADPLPDPPDPLSGDTVDAATMVAPTTDAATMAMPCARHDVSPVGPTPPPDPFLKRVLRDANPGLSPWPCCSVPRSVCPAAPNYAEKPDFARRLRSYRGI